MDVRRLDEMQAQGRSIFDTELAVAYYARVSTDKDEQINSLGNQKRYFEDYIAANPRWTFAGGYVDEGISGTSVEGREQFLKMIETRNAAALTSSSPRRSAVSPEIHSTACATRASCCAAAWACTFRTTTSTLLTRMPNCGSPSCPPSHRTRCASCPSARASAFKRAQENSCCSAEQSVRVQQG